MVQLNLIWLLYIPCNMCLAIWIFLSETCSFLQKLVPFPCCCTSCNILIYGWYFSYIKFSEISKIKGCKFFWMRQSHLWDAMCKMESLRSYVDCLSPYFISCSNTDFTMCALCNLCNSQQVHFASCAIQNMCNLHLILCIGQNAEI